jgi:hypothetical protein
MVLAACGSGNSLEGVYSGENTGFLDKIEFVGADKAELTFMGMTKEATYVVEDGKVKINNAGEVTVLRIDDAGCLDGGGILGKYCKGDAKPAAAAKPAASKPAASAPASNGLIGNRYAAGPKSDQMIVEFIDDSTVRMTVSGDVESLKYTSKGEKVVIQGPDGNKLTMAKRGADLEGDFDGTLIVFKKNN